MLGLTKAPHIPDILPLTLQTGNLPSVLPHIPQQTGCGPGLEAGPRHAFAKSGRLLGSSSGLAVLAQTPVLASLPPFPVPSHTAPEWPP